MMDRAGAIAPTAAERLTRLGGEHATAQGQAAYSSWEAADPRHQHAAQKLQATVDRLQSLRRKAAATQAGSVLDAAHGRSPRYPAAVGASVLILLLALLLPTYCGALSDHENRWTADLCSATGEWTAVVLNDGSRVELASNRCANLHFSARERRIELLAGELRIDVARDPARPFVVQTREGRVRAPGTGFFVHRDPGVTSLRMLESHTAVRAAQRDGEIVVAAGNGVRITPHEVSALFTVDASATENAWQRRQLVVRDRPPTEVFDELSRHRRDRSHYDAQALALHRVSTALPLDQPDRALQLLASGLPIEVHRLTPWRVSVRAKQESAR